MKKLLNMMKILEYLLREMKTAQQRGCLKNNSAGAAIIVIIIGMTVTAILGAGILYLFSSSSFTEVFISNREKAYYLAQAGRQYAAMVINDANIAGVTQPITDLNEQTFTLSGGNQFYLRTNTSDVKRTFVESTGIVNEGTVLETKQKITFAIESIKFSQEVFATGVHPTTGISINIGNNTFIDSYNSNLGPYLETRTEKAIVRTNTKGAGIITLNAGGKIYGNAVCGLGCNPDTDINAPAGTITGVPPKAAASANVSFTAVNPPEPCTDFNSCGTQIPEIILNKSDKRLTTGTYGTTRVELNKGATITISGDVVLIVHKTSTGAGGTLLLNNESKIIIEPKGSLELYIIVLAEIINDSVINPPPSPATVVRILGIETTQLNFTSDSITYGAVYAPGADFMIGSGSQIFGSVIANSITIAGGNPGGRIHVDKGFSTTSDVGNIVY